jgi:hypothetical protein
VAPSRIAGAIMLTDGQVHDVPADPAWLQRPPSRADYRQGGRKATGVIRFERIPASASSASRSTSTYRVLDTEARPGTPVKVTSSINGEQIVRRGRLPSVRKSPLADQIERAGKNILELSIEPRRRRADRRSTITPSPSSTASARTCACCWSPASRMPASAPGATC